MKKLLKKIFSIETQLKIEKFFKEQLWQILIVFAFIFTCAWIFDKYIEAILFCISHLVIRAIFEKQYHCGTTAMCLFLTLTIALFGIMYTFPLALSLLSAIPMCWFISWIGYIAQDRIDCNKIIKDLKHKTIWQMSEDELVDYCYANGIKGDMIEFVVMKVVHEMKYEEIGKKLGYSVDTLKDWSPKCKNKLGVISWKQNKN